MTIGVKVVIWSSVRAEDLRNTAARVLVLWQIRRGPVLVIDKSRAGGGV
jgi:hypothetical protein